MFYITLYLAKIINFFIRFLHLGSGYTWPGHVALSLYPEILSSDKINFPLGFVFVSGTNGKTTTSKLITHLFENNDLKVIHNKTGANLLNGIVSEILLNMDLLGNLSADVGVFEIDENNLPLVLKYISPNVLVLLNLSRDQLDRYGEVDIILENWLMSFEKLDSTTEIVLDSTQHYFKDIRNHFSGDITYFDTDPTYFSKTHLQGDFNIKNVNAAVYTCLLVGLPEEDIINSLPKFSYAYGRGEVVTYHDKEFKILLAKNPASFNNNLDLILSGNLDFDTLVFVLNDNIPDGRDVSWIYDIDYLKLNKASASKSVYVSGTRFLDMNVRLNYASVPVDSSKSKFSIENIFEDIQNNKDIHKILVLPNYSAMLETRKILVGKNIL